MTITIRPLARGERRREVRIGRTGKGYLARTRGAHVLEGLNRWRAYNGMRFPTVAAARAVAQRAVRRRRREVPPTPCLSDAARPRRPLPSLRRRRRRHAPWQQARPRSTGGAPD